MLDDEEEDDEDTEPDVSQFTTWSAVQLGEYGKRHFQLKEDTVSKLVTENVTGASIACLQEQDLIDLKVAIGDRASLRNMVSCTTFPFNSFPETLLQLSFRRSHRQGRKEGCGRGSQEEG